MRDLESEEFSSEYPRDRRRAEARGPRPSGKREPGSYREVLQIAVPLILSTASLTVALFALVLLAEPAGFLMALALGFGVLFAMLTDVDDEAASAPFVGDLLRRWPWRDGLIAALLVVVGVGTLAYWVPSEPARANSAASRSATALPSASLILGLPPGNCPYSTPIKPVRSLINRSRSPTHRKRRDHGKSNSDKWFSIAARQRKA